MKSLFRVLTCVLAIGILTIGCQTESELSDSAKDELMQAVKQKSKDYWALMNQPYDNTTYDETLKFLDENADKKWQTDPVAVIFNTRITNTQDEWYSYFKGLMDNRLSTSITELDKYYSVLAFDKVLEVSTADYFVTQKDSTVSDLYTMVNTSVWTNIDGEWKVQFTHNSFSKK
jgi:hypothetical protein